MRTISEYKENIPNYAMSHLINNDSSGLNEDEIELIDKYMKQFYNEAKENSGYVIIDYTENCSNFTHFPAFGLACDTTECIIMICK